MRPDNDNRATDSSAGVHREETGPVEMVGRCSEGYSGDSGDENDSPVFVDDLVSAVQDGIDGGIPVRLPLEELYPRPWHREVYDARIIIIAANLRRVTEVEPAQRGGRIPTRPECMALADLIIEAVNGR